MRLYFESIYGAVGYRGRSDVPAPTVLHACRRSCPPRRCFMRAVGGSRRKPPAPRASRGRRSCRESIGITALGAKISPAFRAVVCACVLFKSRSQEVVGGPPGHVGLAAAWCRVKLQESVVERVIELHDGGLVAAAVAVVGRAKDGHHVAVMRPVVSLGRNGTGAWCKRKAGSQVSRTDKRNTKTQWGG